MGISKLTAYATNDKGQIRSKQYDNEDYEPMYDDLEKFHKLGWNVYVVYSKQVIGYAKKYSNFDLLIFSFEDYVYSKMKPVFDGVAMYNQLMQYK